MTESYASRDATSLRILGSFFVILGVLVLFGAVPSWGETAKVVVNLACGAALAGIGGVMLVISRRFRNTAAAESGESE
jgi:hypothetical protein